MKSSHRRITVGLVTAGLTMSLGGVGVAGAAEVSSSPVRLIVGLKAGVAAETPLQSAARVGVSEASIRRGKISRELSAELRAKSVEVPKAKASAAIAALESDPNVTYVEVDKQYRAFDVAPNDPLFRDNHQPELRQINVPAAWDTTTGAKVKVAVLDTGVSEVGDLTGKVLPGFDFYNYDDDASDDDRGADFRHGTVVASLIAATPNNGVGMAGVCAQCDILPVKVLGGRDGSGSAYDIAQGIIYAVRQGAKIINMSLGSSQRSTTIANAVAYANAKGVLVVAAAGNDGDTGLNYPAALPDVLSVGATNTRISGGRTRADFSNYGAWVDVAAPGITAGMWNNGRYCYDGNYTACNGYTVQGTSFAAPLVAGVAALVASKNPRYSGWSLQYAITKSSLTRDLSWVAFGLVDAKAALAVGTDLVPPTVTGMAPRQNVKVHGTVTVTPTGLGDAVSKIRVVDLYVDGKWHSWAISAPYAPKLNTAGRNGAVKLQLRVIDKAGNITWSPVRTLIADNIKPKVSITKAPKNKAKVKGTVKVYAGASDKSGISKVQLLVNGKVVATDTTSGYKLTFKVASQKKTMKVRVRAYDKAGNVSYVTTRTYYRA